MRKYKFKSIRVKKFDPKPTQPDYSNIIRLNGVDFTLTGWLDLRSDIIFTLEKITPERLKKDRYLRARYAAFLSPK